MIYEIKDNVLNNGFDLIKDKGLRIKRGRAESRERMKFNEIRFTLHE